jgi:hypothetical protein
MKNQVLFVFAFALFLLNACKNESPNSSASDVEIEKGIPNRVNHLFSEKYDIYIVDLKPQYMDEEKGETKDSSRNFFTSIIRKTGIDTSLILTKSEITNDSALKQLQIVLNDTSTTRTAYECYTPRHGIAWYNSNNELEAFLEICFECQDYKTWGNISISGQKDGAWFKRLETVLR